MIPMIPELYLILSWDAHCSHRVNCCLYAHKWVKLGMGATLSSLSLPQAAYFSFFFSIHPPQSMS